MLSTVKYKVLFPFVIALVSNLANAQDKASIIRSHILNLKDKNVLVVAHRGDWRNAPENSIMAIENAIRMGVDVVEIDIQRTKDGKLILVHDETLDRTTTGKGKISDFNSSHIDSLNLRDGLGIKTDQKIPSLEDALWCAKGKVMLNLDKADRFFDDVVLLLEKTGTMSQIIMKGQKPFDEVQQRYGKYLNEIIYMPIVYIDKRENYDNFKAYSSQKPSIAYEIVFGKNNPYINEVISSINNKSSLWLNTMWNNMSGDCCDDRALSNPDVIYGKLVKEYHVKLIQTDRPEKLIQYLKSINRHD